MDLNNRLSSIFLFSIVIVCFIYPAFAADYAYDGAKLKSTFDHARYTTILAREIADIDSLIADYESRQYEWLPVVPPDPDYVMVQPMGLFPFDPTGFPSNFIESLVPTAPGGGIAVYPIIVYETDETVSFRR